MASATRAIAPGGNPMILASLLPMIIIFVGPPADGGVATAREGRIVTGELQR